MLNWNVCLPSGTLQTRSLNGIVRKEDLVVSEYLTTLLVVVTRLVTLNVTLPSFYGITQGFHVLLFCMCKCVSVYVFGPRGSYLQWERTYESLSEFVVPRSSR